MRKENKEIESLNTFIIHDAKENIPNDFKFITVHFTFDIEYDGRWKARLVVGGASNKSRRIRDIFRGSVH